MSVPVVGDTVTARVKAIANYGAWIEWDGHQALVEIHYVSPDALPPIRHPGDVLVIGQEVKAKILIVLDSPRRIRASIKDAE